jgi:hypothetical protein
MNLKLILYFLWRQFLVLPTKESLFLWMSFVFPSLGHVGPPYITTLTLPRLTIGLPVWLFSTPVNDPYASHVSTPPQENQPPVTLHLLHPLHLLPFFLLRLVKDPKLVTRWIRRRRKGRLRRRKIRKGPSLKPLQVMLEAINQLLSIRLGILMRFTSLLMHSSKEIMKHTFQRLVCLA